MLAFYKKNKREESDKAYDWRNLELKVESYHSSIECYDENIQSISSVLSLICESLTIQLNNNQQENLNKTQIVQNEVGLQTERKNSRNIMGNKHIDAHCQLNKTQELWHIKVSEA